MNYTVTKVELLGLVVLVFVLGAAFGLNVEQEERTTVLPELTVSDGETIGSASTKLVAVTRDGRGVVTDLNVRTIAGTGRILVDIDNLLFFVDTQFSMQKARDVASDYLNTSATDRDLIYTIRVANTSVVAGESAGAALTVATIAALSGKELRGDAIITGTIEPDGSIGRVGGLINKAEAASDAGYSLFLVPRGESTIRTIEPKRTCSTVDSITVCTTTYETRTVGIGEKAGIEVREVSNVDEAVELMIPGF